MLHRFARDGIRQRGVPGETLLPHHRRHPLPRPHPASAGLPEPVQGGVAIVPRVGDDDHELPMAKGVRRIAGTRRQQAEDKEHGYEALLHSVHLHIGLC